MAGLGELRLVEQQSALVELGVASSEVFQMHLPDGNVVAFEEALVDLVHPFIQPKTLLVAPWSIHTRITERVDVRRNVL
jgi:hypothetical protein